MRAHARLSCCSARWRMPMTSERVLKAAAAMNSFEAVTAAWYEQSWEVENAVNIGYDAFIALAMIVKMPLGCTPVILTMTSSELLVVLQVSKTLSCGAFVTSRAAHSQWRSSTYTRRPFISITIRQVRGCKHDVISSRQWWVSNFKKVRIIVLQQWITAVMGSAGIVQCSKVSPVIHSWRYQLLHS